MWDLISDASWYSQHCCGENCFINRRPHQCIALLSTKCLDFKGISWVVGRPGKPGWVGKQLAGEKGKECIPQESQCGFLPPKTHDLYESSMVKTAVCESFFLAEYINRRGNWGISTTPDQTTSHYRSLCKSKLIFLTYAIKFLMMPFSRNES